MMMKRFVRVAIHAVAAGSICAPALAQQTSGSNSATERTVLEEIVVTATKRTESLENVALSVSVVDTSALAEHGATDYRDYITSVPGVSLVDTGGILNRVIVRGLATAADVEGGGGPTVVTYFDEVPLGGGLGAINIEPLDLARVEVLRGPQGTLYGAGSVGGTLRFIPNNPEPGDFFGFANASLADRSSADGQDYNVRGGVNVPLGEAAALRAAAYYREDADFITNLRTGQEVGGLERYGAQVSALVNFGERTQAVLRYVYDDAETANDGLRQLGMPGEAVTDSVDQSRSRRTDIGAFTLTHDFSGATLTVASGYVDNSDLQARDLSNFIGLPTRFDSRQENRTFTQELRLASTGEDRVIDWLVGGYYERSRRDADGALTILAPPSFPVIQTRRRAEQYAAFGQLDWHFADRWTVAAGGRYADYSNNQRNMLNGTNPGSSDSTFNPSVALEYRPEGDRLYYARAARGFRPGTGQNHAAQPTPACQAQADAAIPTEITSDKLWSYELGAKWTFGTSGTLNADIFYADWNGVPIVLNYAPAPPCRPDTYTDNLGKGEVMGAEIEMVLRPVAGLTLVSSLAYSDTELVDGSGAFDYDEGRPLPASPKWNASLAATYEFPLTASWTATFGGDIHYVGSYNFYLETDFFNFCSVNCRSYVGTALGDVRQPRVGGYTQVNLNAGLGTDRYRVNLFVNNLFNEETTTGLLFDGATTDLLASSLRRRTIGISMGVNF